MYRQRQAFPSGIALVGSSDVQRLRQMWIEAQSSLWMVPSIIVAASAALAFILIQLDEILGFAWLNKWSRLFGAGAEGSRGMLEAIATSMITVAGVTFSITVAALAQASSQYSPLVLRNFMRDRANQIVLGAFGGIFVYCLIVLRTIRSEPDEFIPTIAVSTALLHAVVGIGLLVFFVHHIANSLQASSILANISTSAGKTIDRDFPLRERLDLPEGTSSSPLIPPNAVGIPILSKDTGYVQDIGADAILDLADKRDCIIVLTVRIGDFAIRGLPLGHVYAHLRPCPGIEDEARGAIIIGEHRTSERDLLFSVRQIVDMAVRALSPGINDPTTADFCLHHLAAIMFNLGDRVMPHHVLARHEQVRVTSPPLTYAAFARLAFSEIRHHGSSDPRVLWAIAEAILYASMQKLIPDRRRTLMHELKLTAAAADSLAPGEPRDALLARIKEVESFISLERADPVDKLT